MGGSTLRRREHVPLLRNNICSPAVQFLIKIVNVKGTTLIVSSEMNNVPTLEDVLFILGRKY